MQIAILTAHPDDAEIYAGGMILAWRAMGAAVTILIATDGARGGKGDPAELAATRAEEAAAAARRLDADLVLLGHGDGRLAETPAYPVDLAERIAVLAPDLILAHSSNDYHPDHRAVAAAALGVAGFSRPVAWLDTMMGVGFAPTHIIDTTPFQSAKDAAILAHVSQEPERFVDSARQLARFRAAQCGHGGFAEAIRHDPVFPFADIRSLLPPSPPVRGVRDRSR